MRRICGLVPLWFIAFWFIAAGLVANAQTPSASGDPADQNFATQVAVVLETHCIRCHGPQLDESGLRLDRSEFLHRGGDRGPAVVAGDAESSWLFRAVSPDDDEIQMPPEGDPLPDRAIDSLRDWIEAGARWPDSIDTLTARFAIGDDDRDYWAFVPPADVDVPVTLDDDWSRNEIDRFVLRRMRDAGLHPTPSADRGKLIRRLFYDLIGLPPTASEIANFVADTDPLAYPRLVDDLLRRPEYGQRWARHWLDLVRYAESDGFKADVYRPHAWVYRDYVVQSLNDDKPYDRFLLEQLAGDELFPTDPQARTATGYLRLWPLEDNQKDVKRQWTFILDDITEVTSEVFLGLGIRCAKCHDHKYDPIPQADYYRLRAFFAALLPRNDLQVPQRGDMRQLSQWENETRPIRRAMRQIEDRYIAERKSTIKAYPRYLQVLYDKPMDQWTSQDRQYAYLARPQIEKRSSEQFEFKGEMRQQWAELTQRLDRHHSVKPEALTVAMTVTDVGPNAPPTYLANNPSYAEVAPGFLTVLDAGDAIIEPIDGNPTTTGRRAALARWLTQPDHPLTSRVIVNRIWQQHFGRGIVTTANDFGHQGTRPSHPELLDWLAKRFVADGWSLKQLHRLIATSATYRQDLSHDTEDVALREEMFCGRLPHRLDSEQIRDGMLMASGELQPYRPEPSVDGEQPIRSLMIKNVRNRPDEWLSTLDGPDMFNSCAKRFVTTTPLQSLMVLNSPWSLKRAEAMAKRIQDSSSGEAARCVLQAFQHALSRNPKPEELELAEQFIQQEGQLHSPSFVDLCHVLLCSNEFIYVD